MSSEKASLLEGQDQRSPRATRVLKKIGRGVAGTLGIPLKGSQSGHFTSSLGVLLSMLGCVVGTGNIWRYPRIVALHAEEGGALAFLIVWFLFLWLWSMPLILIENGVGRFTGKAPVEAFSKLLGPSYRWMGAFLTAVTLGIGSYYSVLLGYCSYYVVETTFNPLPDNLEQAEASFDYLQNSYWPVLTHFLGILFACICLSRGVSTIEPANRIIVPILLVLVVFTFYWALFLPSASEGIVHMFSPTWEAFGDSSLWRDALTQNAWDTGAGAGSFLTYATYMTRTQGAVKLGAITPIINNIVSLLCGMMIFCNVFSRELYKGSSINKIIDVLKTNGPFNTGVTFIQMPLLYASISGGRVLAVMFFLCLTLAGLSSLISLLEQSVHVLEDFGVRRYIAVIAVGLLSFSIGLASALDINIFVNQDAVWAHALIVSGCFLIFLVARYGALKFRRVLYNEYGIGDWPLPYLWVFVVIFICPIEGIGMIIWWIVDEIRLNADPYKEYPFWVFTTTSLITILTEWIIVLCILIGLNWWMKPLNKWRSYVNPPGILPPPPTTCTERFAACLCKTQQEQSEEDEKELAKEALAKAHQNPWDTPSTSQSSPDSSYSSTALPLTSRKTEIEKKKRKDSTLEIDDIEL